MSKLFLMLRQKNVLTRSSINAKEIYWVGHYSCKEILQSKILYGAVLLALFLLFICFVASQFTYGAVERVTLDIGLGLITFSMVGIALFLGARLISQEIENKTIFMALTRSISRSDFIMGKLLGLNFVLLLNLALLGTTMVGIYVLVGGKPVPLIFYNLLFIYLQSTLILCLVVLFSLFVTTALSVIYTLTLYVAGHVLSHTQDTSLVHQNVVLEKFLMLYGYVFPEFYRFNIKDFVLYESSLPIRYIGMTYLYGILYLTCLVIIMVYVFKRKSFE